MALNFPFDRPITRRTAVGALTAVGAGAAGASMTGTSALAQGPAATRMGPQGQVESRFLFFDDPAEEFRAHMRMERDFVDEGDTVTWYHMVVFVIPEGTRPLPFVRYEGIEFSYHRNLGNNNYRVHAHNMSFPRDLETGEFITEVINPVTNKNVAIPPTIILNDPGTILTPQGNRNLSGDGAPTTFYRFFRYEDNLIKLDSVRTAPPDWPYTHLENSCQWVDRELFADESITSLPVGFAGSYVYPYPEWLEMGERGGHMLMFFDGKKIDSTGQLPEDFLKKAEADYPELLQPRLGEFDRPIPFDL